MNKLITAALVLLFSMQVHAGITTYAISDAAGNCGAAGALGGHGLWTNSLLDVDVDCPDSSQDVGNYFSVLGGNLFVDEDNSLGFLTFSASNGAGNFATVEINLAGLVDPWTGPVKNPFGADVSAWDVFSDIAGTIDIDGTIYSVSGHGAMGFQIGYGANDKNTGLGASTWLDVAGAGYSGGHWDINLNITTVPAPASLALLGLGLMGLGAARRRRAN